MSAPSAKCSLASSVNRRTGMTAGLLISAHSLVSRSMHAEAEARFQDVLSHDERDAEAHDGLSRCLEKREEFVGAMEHAAKAAELRGDAKHLLHYAELLADFRELARAAEHTARALELEPLSTEAIYLHSRILSEMAVACYAQGATASAPPSLQPGRDPRGHAFILRTSESNQNSIAALLGCVATHRDLDGVRFVLSRDVRRACAEELRTERVIGVGFSAMSAQMPQLALEILLQKAAYPDVPVVVGGPHASAAPEDLLGLGVDVVVLGPAEETFPRLLRSLRDGTDLAAMDGIAVEREGSVFARAPRPVPLDPYLPLHPRHEVFGPVEIQRGCFFSCRYCQTGCSRKVEHRSIASIVAFCRTAIDRGCTDLRFVSPDAFAYAKRHPREDNAATVRALLEAIAGVEGEKRIFFGSFPSEVRPDSVTPRLLEIVADHVAERELHVGMQAATDRMLRHIRRGHTVDDARRAVDLLLQHGFAPVVHLILSLPGEAQEDREATLEEICRLTAQGAMVRVHTFMPLPGTVFAEEKPGVVDEETYAKLRGLVSQGFVLGHFHRQDRIGHEVNNYMARRERFGSLPPSLRVAASGERKAERGATGGPTC